MSAMPVSASTIRVLSAEDHYIFSEGLRTIVDSQTDMKVVGQATTAEEVVDAFKDLLPDVTLMDLWLRGSSGVDALVQILGLYPNARIIMLTTSDLDGDIQRALRAGASAYVLKSTPKNELLRIIRSVHAGIKHIPADVATKLAEHLGDEELSNRELEVLRLVRDGYKNKQISAELNIAETTVNYHMKNIVEKLHANDRAHAVAIAIRRGICG